MRIGELLIMNGLITKEQLEKALQKQTHSFKKIGEILIEDELISERQLVEALEFQLGIPVISLDEVTPNRTSLRLVDESIARKHCLMPIEHKEGKIKVAMVDPLNQEAMKDVQASSGLTVQPCLATRSQLEKAIISHFGVLDSVKELTEIINNGIQKNATDIHLDAHKDGLVIRYRVNNALENEKTIPKQLQEAVIGRIKTISNMNAAERNRPQTGYIRKELYNNQSDIRVSTLPTLDGESVVFNLIKPNEESFKLETLGLTESNLNHLKKALEQKSGLILLTGPAISGKTTQFNAILNHLNNNKHKIVSIENLVKRRINGILQVEVSETNGFSFTDALKSIINQDPNIVFLSDIPDASTAEVATRVALSGRLVIGNMHGFDSIHTIRRLLDMGIEPYLIASSLSCIVGQRIAPKICERCANMMPASEEELKLFEAHNLVEYSNQKEKSKIGNFRSFVTTNKNSKVAVYKGVGCKQCNNTGFDGHIGFQEVLPVDEKLKEMILKKSSIEEFKQYLKEKDFNSLLYDGLSKAREGITTVDGVLTAIN